MNLFQCQNVIQTMSMNDCDSTGIVMFRNQLIFIFLFFVAFNNRSELVDKADGEFMRFSLSSDDVIVLNTKDVRVSVSFFCIVTD